MIPVPALLLVGSALASDLFPTLGGLSATTNEWIVTVALALILFDGGMDIGVRRLRTVFAAVLWLGTAGTLVTAAAMAGAAHAWFGFGWRQACLVGAALAPTDPAVVFSLLRGRSIPGRSRTLLEGESGFNDPIGIALLITILHAHNAHAGQIGAGVLRFALQMLVGAAVGVGGGWALQHLMRRLPVPERWFPVVALVVAAPVFVIATLGQGSGFLAVFIAGIVVGDEHRATIARLTDPIGEAAEVVAFVVLGLSVSLSHIVRHHHAWTGIALAALLILAVRPVLVGLLLWPVRLRRRERVFVLWAGFKGAVPILLGTLVLAHGVAGQDRIYDVIFVVVVVSVVVQGALLPRFTPRA